MSQIWLLFYCLVAGTAFGQKSDPVASVLQKIVAHAEKASLYREKIGWDTLRQRVFELAEQAKTVPELGPALKYLLKALGDEHGRVFHNNQIIAYAYGPLKPHQQSFQSEIYAKIQSGKVYAFATKALTPKIGYVRVVGLPMGDNTQMAQAIETEICALAQSGIDHWVVDLRYNGGGNMHPMAEGLALLIGDWMVGGTKGLTLEESSKWAITKGNFYYDDYSINLPSTCKVNRKPKVAVLTSIYTASSGEALAVIFKGREHTRFFGEKTMGMVTATDWEVIDPATAMTISVSYYQDRNGKVYDQYVDVDESLPFVTEPLSADDFAANRALAWLKGEK